METRIEETRLANGTASTPPDTREDARGGAPRTERSFWDVAGLLYQRRRFIGMMTAAVAIASVLIALLLPRWYMGEARVLQPEGGGVGSLLGMVNRAAGGLGSLLGGGGGYERYLAILTSRTMLERVVDEFDLVAVYDTEGKRAPRVAAVEKLEKNLDFAVSLDYDFLGVRAYDRDPERAAAMANFLVASLNEEYGRLTSQSARLTRVYIEDRLARAEADLDSIRSQLQDFQETSGVVELESQAEAFMRSAADLKAEAAQLDIQYQTLLQQYGPDNPQVRAARDARNAASAQIRGLLGGRDELLPVSMRDLPTLTRRYAEIMQGQLIQAQIIETIYPFYEQALLQERSEAEAVQVVDEAVPPVRAARPSRRLIVIGATLSGLLVACAYVLAHAWLRDNRARIARHLNGA